MMKRWIAVVLSAVLALSLVACGHKKNDDGEKVIAAMEKMSAAQSYHSTMETEMRMEIPEIGEMGMHMQMDMACFVDPMKAKVEMMMEIAGERTDLSMFLQQKDGKYEVYVLNGSEWMSAELSSEELTQMDTKASLQMYVDNSKSFSFAGTEEIQGRKADRYDGVIEGETMEKAMAATGNTTGMMWQDLGIDEEVFQDLGKLPLSVWIDQESGYPVHYSMDMTDIMGKMMEKITAAMGVEDLEIKVGEMVISVSFSDFDAIPDFEAPVVGDASAA